MIQTTPEIRDLLDSIWEFLDSVIDEADLSNEENIHYLGREAMTVQDLIRQKSDYVQW
jgi:hypothetical protein